MQGRQGSGSGPGRASEWTEAGEGLTLIFHDMWHPQNPQRACRPPRPPAARQVLPLPTQLWQPQEGPRIPGMATHVPTGCFCPAL